jgi:hypothetical protein
MKLGAFSISLAVKDLKVSKVFYEKIGFAVFGGSLDHNYLIMKNQEGKTLKAFTDVRNIYKELKNTGLNAEQVTLEGNSGPGSFVVVDPDGNSILIDQHI